MTRCTWRISWRVNALDCWPQICSLDGQPAILQLLTRREILLHRFFEEPASRRRRYRLDRPLKSFTSSALVMCCSRVATDGRFSSELQDAVGSPKRRNGILNNEVYRGVIVYNRQRFLKDPMTGKRVSRPNPESEWLRQEVEQLRIVDESLWQSVQTLRASRGGTRPHEQRRPQRLLSGLMYCGCSGSKYNIASKDWLRCSSQVNSGTCPESRPIRMGEVEQRVLSSVEQHLLTPEMIDAAIEAYRDEMVRAHGERVGVRERLAAELADVEKKSARLLRLVEDGNADPAVAGPRLNELAAQKRVTALVVAGACNHLDLQLMELIRACCS